MLSHLIFVTPLGIELHNSLMDKHSQVSLASGFGVMSICFKAWAFIPSYPAIL